MDLEEDQIVGVVKYPVSHRSMAYGARPAPSGAAEKPKAGAVLRDAMLQTGVVKVQPW